MKHTKGLWKICDDGINVYAEPDIAITNQDHPCAPNQDEAEANARLIAAAPIMFEALEVLCNWPMNSIRIDGKIAKNGAESLANARRFARQAIAKILEQEEEK